MGSFSLLPSTEHETGLHVQYSKSLRCCPYLPVTNVAFVWSPWNRFRTAWNMENSDPRNRIKDLNKRSWILANFYRALLFSSHNGTDICRPLHPTAQRFCTSPLWTFLSFLRKFRENHPFRFIFQEKVSAIIKASRRGIYLIEFLSFTRSEKQIGVNCAQNISKC